MMKRTIAFEDFPVPHTGVALFKMMRKVFIKIHLEEKGFSITLDNASNNTKAIGRLQLKYSPPMDDIFYHSRCVAHIINLVVQAGLAVLPIDDHLDATDRIQHTSNLENSLDFEETILDEEVLANEAISLSDEEIALDKAANEARSNEFGDEIEITSD
ncbi:zinc finger BED domain-containing protein RICESLEEPER 2-like protein [Tanacetum coccineum]